jgi:hypothetical protein
MKQRRTDILSIFLMIQLQYWLELLDFVDTEARFGG